jgi:DNA-binding transcriptional LysR family regulator
VLLDLESLRCFVSAATHLSFRSAARECALSPAAFGERIRKLEDELGARLFDRTTRRVVVTPEGVRLLPQAKRCLDEAQRCAAVVSSDEKPPFDLVIGTRFELGMSFVLPAFAALEKARPDRRLHLYVGDTMDIVPRILRDEVSCMITSARIATPGLSFARLHQEDYVFVGARSLLDKQPFTKPADACSTPAGTCRSSAISSTRARPTRSGSSSPCSIWAESAASERACSRARVSRSCRSITCVPTCRRAVSGNSFRPRSCQETGFA